MNSTPKDPEIDADMYEFYRDIAEIQSAVKNEPILHKRIEPRLNPPPAALATSETAAALNGRIERIVVELGGSPNLIIQGHGEPLQKYDTYVNAIFSEAILVFRRARRSVLRAHVAFVAMGASHLELLTPKFEEEQEAALTADMHEQFWERAEFAYIRLASYWDRVAQILDFVFFKIRQFERDGFTAVMDRIVVNLEPMDTALRDSPSWRALRAFQKSEEPAGLHWLLRRRNLLVHSLHLQPLVHSPEERLFESQYNHLDAKLRKKLKPGTPQEEVERMHVQLSAACRLFADVLELCEHGSQSRSAP